MGEHNENHDKSLLGDMIFAQLKLAKENGQGSPNGGKRAAEPVEPISKELYLDDFKDIEKKLLPLDHFKNLLKEFRKNRHDLKTIFPKGTRYLLAAIPVNDSGYTLDDQKIAAGEYLRPLLVGKNGLTYYYSLKPGKYADVLPAEMQNECGFEVMYSDDVPNFVNDDDYETFIKNYLLAFNNLRKFFGKTPLSPKDFASMKPEDVSRDFGELIQIGFLEKKAA